MEARFFTLIQSRGVRYEEKQNKDMKYTISRAISA